MPLSALESTQSIASPCVRPLTVHHKACFILRQAFAAVKSEQTFDCCSVAPFSERKD